MSLCANMSRRFNLKYNFGVADRDFFAFIESKKLYHKCQVNLMCACSRARENNYEVSAFKRRMHVRVHILYYYHII